MNALKQRRELTADALMLTLSALTVKLIGVIYKLPLSYMLGDEGMGYFNSAYTVFGCFYVICTAGVPKAVSILVCEARAREDNATCRKILSYTSRIFLLIGAVFTLLLLFFARPLSAAVGNEGACASVICVSFSLIFISVSGVMRGYLNGMGRQVPIALCEIVEAAFKLFVGLGLAKLSIARGYGLQLTAAFAVSGISIGAAASSMLLYLFSSNRGGARVGFSADRGILLRIIKISLPIAASALLTSVTNIIDLLLTMRRLSDIGYTAERASALYGNYTTLAVPFLGLCIALVAPVSTAALPKLSSAYIKSDVGEYYESLTHAILLSSFIGAALSFGCMYFSYEGLRLVFPDESATLGAPYLSMLSPSFILCGALICVNTALEAAGKTAAPLISMSVGTAVKICVAYVLTGNEKIGIGAAAIGTVLFYASALCVSVITLFLTLGVRVRIFIPIISTIFCGGASALCAKLIQELTKTIASDTQGTLICGAVYAILYLILSKFIVFSGKKVKKPRDFAQKENTLLLKYT